MIVECIIHSGIPNDTKLAFNSLKMIQNDIVSRPINQPLTVITLDPGRVRSLKIIQSMLRTSTPVYTHALNKGGSRGGGGGGGCEGGGAPRYCGCSQINGYAC